MTSTRHIVELADEIDPADVDWSITLGWRVFYDIPVQ